MLFAVDPTAAVVDEVIETGADLLVTHHPLLLTPVHGVPADDPKGRLVHRLIRAGAALFVAHTNADRAPGTGVNDALADVLGLTGAVPLEPAAGDPRAGLGRVGRAAGADDPARVRRAGGRGAAGDRRRRAGRRATPTGRCAGSRCAAAAADRCCGAAAAAGADVFLTSDLKHHPVSDALEVDGPALCDVAHFATRVALAAGGGGRAAPRPGRRGWRWPSPAAHRPVDASHVGQAERTAGEPRAR